MKKVRPNLLCAQTHHAAAGMSCDTAPLRIRIASVVSAGNEWAGLTGGGWGVGDQAVKVKAAKEAEKNRPAGAVGEDGLTYKQRQNRKRAEKKKAERDTVNQVPEARPP